MSRRATNLISVYAPRESFVHEQGKHVWALRAMPSALIPEGVPSWEKGPADRMEILAAFEKAYPR